MSARRSRVLTVVPGLEPGGAEIGLLRLLPATSEEFEHHVVTLRAGGSLATRFAVAGLRPQALDMSRLWLRPWRVVALAQLIRRLEPELIVGHMYRAALVTTVGVALARRRVPLLWVFHNSLGDGRHGPRAMWLQLGVVRRLASRAAQIAYLSRRSRADHLAVGFPATRAELVTNGIDLDEFRADPAARARLRAEWQAGDDETLIIHCARVGWAKDHATLLAAFETALADVPRLRLVLCGGGTEELGVPDAIAPRVLRLGHRDDVAAVMAAADIGVLSSLSESLPTVLIELMALERPCVTTDAGDAADIVGEHGLVVPVGDPASLARALVTLARMPPAARAELGAGARTSIAERYSLPAVAARHAALWRALIDGGRRGPEAPTAASAWRDAG